MARLAALPLWIQPRLPKPHPLSLLALGSLALRLTQDTGIPQALGVIREDARSPHACQKVTVAPGRDLGEAQVLTQQVYTTQDSAFLTSSWWGQCSWTPRER